MTSSTVADTSTVKESRGRILVVTNGNYFSAHGLHPLLVWAKENASIDVMVTTGLRRPNRNPLLETWRLLRTWGVRYSLYKAATYLLPSFSQLVSRHPHFVESLCGRLGIPVTKYRSLNTAEARAHALQFAPDVLVSFSCPYRIRRELLSLPTIGSLNVHSSLLPNYAGVCTYVHVLAENQTRTGITVHEMVEEFDAGKILAQREIDIPLATTVAALFLAQCNSAGPLLSETVQEMIRLGTVPGREQDSSLRSYRSEPTHAEITSLTANGHALLRANELFLLTTPALSPDHSASNPRVNKVLRELGYAPATGTPSQAATP